MTLVYLSIAFAAGILLGSEFHLPAWSMAFGLIPLALLIPFRNRLKLIITISACLVLFAAGAIRYESSMSSVGAGNVSAYNDTGTVTLKGTVATAPDARDTNTRLTIRATEVDAGTGANPASGRVLIFTSRYPAHDYGDVLAVTGKIETPTSSGEFDYKGYLAGQGIYSVIYYPHIEVIRHGAGFKPLAWVYSARRALATKMAQVLPEPQAALAQGIVLGCGRVFPHP